MAGVATRLEIRPLVFIVDRLIGEGRWVVSIIQPPCMGANRMARFKDNPTFPTRHRVLTRLDLYCRVSAGVRPDGVNSRRIRFDLGMLSAG